MSLREEIKPIILDYAMKFGSSTVLLDDVLGQIMEVLKARGTYCKAGTMVIDINMQEPIDQDYYIVFIPKEGL